MSPRCATLRGKLNTMRPLHRPARSADTRALRPRWDHRGRVQRCWAARGDPDDDRRAPRRAPPPGDRPGPPPPRRPPRDDAGAERSAAAPAAAEREGEAPEREGAAEPDAVPESAAAADRDEDR